MRIRLRLQLAADARAEAGAVELLRVTAMPPVNRTCVPQGPDDLAVEACRSLSLQAVADAARRGKERGGSVYVPAPCAAGYVGWTPASARYSPTVRA